MKGNLSRLVPAIERELKEAKSRIQRKLTEKALIESEERFRFVSSLISDIAYSCITQGDGPFSINWMTGAPERITGYSIEEIRVQRCWRFLVIDEDLALFEKNVSNLTPGSNGSCELRIRHKNGGIVWIASYAECRIMAAEESGRLILYGGLIDITKRKEAERILLFERDKLEAVTKNVGVGLAIISKDYRTIWANPVIKDIFGETEGKLCYVTYNQQQSVCSWCGVRRVFENGEDNVSTEAMGHDKDGNLIWSQIITTPIRNEAGEVTSALEVVFPITERKKAEDERQQNLERLRQALGATVQAIAIMVETRDPYTAGHQRRVADLARSIATEMKLSSDLIDSLRTAGMIHDIGKIAVPAEILSKPTRLTEIEFGLIKLHPQSGYDILKDIDFPSPIARMVLEHHERLDGSGYPNGLTGKDLLVESRILAVADVVESMASHRPYRPARGIDLALDEIRNNRGIIYDADVVDACLSLFRDKGFQLTY
jgi:PAS domain S-box-containing protein